MDDTTGGHDELIERLGGLTAPIHPARQASDLAAMAAAVSSRRGLLGSKVRVAAAFLAGLLLGSTGLAAADALPDPAQHVAHQVLDRVGVQVPDPERYHGPECGTAAKRNHGAYVRDNHALAQTECGKKVKAAGAEDEGDAPGKDKAAEGPCQAKPPWAGSTMTSEQKAAAQAQREATCPDDADGVEAEVDDEATELDARTPAPEGTTTTVAPTTTTTAAETNTTTESTTTTSSSGS